MSGITKTIVRTAEACRASPISRTLHTDQLLIVMYHRILSEQKTWDHRCQIPTGEFRWQIEYLKRHYEVLPLVEIVSRLAGDKPLKPKCAAITFDDGLRNKFEVAFPVLRELNVPATMYLATGYIDTDALLWQDRLFAEIPVVRLDGTPPVVVQFWQPPMEQSGNAAAGFRHAARRTQTTADCS